MEWRQKSSRVESEFSAIRLIHHVAAFNRVASLLLASRLSVSSLLAREGEVRLRLDGFALAAVEWCAEGRIRHGLRGRGVGTRAQASVREASNL